MRGGSWLYQLVGAGLAALIVVAGLATAATITQDAVPALNVEFGLLGEFLDSVEDGQTANFGAKSSSNSVFEVKGWHAREETFAWSGSGRHEIWFMIEPKIWGSAIEGDIEIRLQGFVPVEEVGPRNLEANIATSSESFSFQIPDVPTDVRIPFRGVFSEKIVLVLHVNDALRPRDFGSTDERSLGVQLISAKISLQLAAP